MTIETNSWLTTRVTQESRVPEINLLFAQFPGEEYLQVERAIDGVGVMWSGNVAVAQCVNLAHESLREQARSSERCVSYLSIPSEPALDELSTPELEQLLASRGTEVSWLSAGYESCVIGWREAQRKLVSDSIRHREIAFSAETTSPQRLLDFIGKTATQQVATALQRSAQPLIDALDL